MQGEHLSRHGVNRRPRCELLTAIVACTDIEAYIAELACITQSTLHIGFRRIGEYIELTVQGRSESPIMSTKARSN